MARCCASATYSGVSFASPALVHAPGFGNFDAFTLPLPDQGAFELSDRAEQVQLERGGRILGARDEGTGQVLRDV